MKQLFHYTSIGALESILQADGIHLRLTNVRQLNDIKETRIGFNRICKINGKQIANPKRYSIATDKEMLDSTFTCSFSSVINKVPLWAMYADNGAGVAIGFDVSKLRENIKKQKLGFVDCRYDPKTITKSYLEKIENEAPLEIRALKDGNLFVKLWSDNHVCIQYKADSYDYECESRIYWVGQCANILGNHQTIKHRPKGGNLVSYIEIIIPKDVLTCIYVGPVNKGNKKLLTYIKELTSSLEFDSKVIQSRLSYRG